MSPEPEFRQILTLSLKLTNSRIVKKLSSFLSISLQIISMGTDLLKNTQLEIQYQIYLSHVMKKFAQKLFTCLRPPGMYCCAFRLVVQVLKNAYCIL